MGVTDSIVLAGVAWWAISGGTADIIVAAD